MMAFVKEGTLEEQHGLALRDHLRRRSTALLIEDPHGNVTDVGSGTLIQIADRYFVATVAHNFDDVERKQIGVSPFGEVDVYTNQTPKVIGWGRRGCAGQQVDVGWLEIEPRAVPALVKWGNLFVPFERLRIAPVAAGTPVFLLGQPAQYIKPTTRNGAPFIGLRALPFLTQSLDATGLGDPTHDLYVGYPRIMQTGEGPKEMPRAPGLSGSGIWAVNARADGLWAPDLAQLVAVQRSWEKDEWSWLRGCLTRDWLEMVREDIPALSEPIDRVLRASVDR